MGTPLPDPTCDRPVPSDPNRSRTSRRIAVAEVRAAAGVHAASEGADRSGRFYCTVCRYWRKFQWMRVEPRSWERFRAWLGRYRCEPYDVVECTICRRHFGEEALHFNPTAARKRRSERRNLFHRLVRNSMAVVAQINGRCDDCQAEMVRTIDRQLEHREMCNEEIVALFLQCRHAREHSIEEIREFYGQMTLKRRTLLVRAVTRVAAADGDMDPLETQYIRDIGAAAGLSPRATRRIVDNARRKLGIRRSDPIVHAIALG